MSEFINEIIDGALYSEDEEIVELAEKAEFLKDEARGHSRWAVVFTMGAVALTMLSIAAPSFPNPEVRIGTLVGATMAEVAFAGMAVHNFAQAIMENSNANTLVSSILAKTNKFLP